MSSACSRTSFISVSHGFDPLSNCEGCLIRPSEAEPHPTLQQVDDSLGEAALFG